MKPLPPGPQGSLIAGCTDEFKVDPLGFLVGCQRTFGNVVPFRIGPYPALFVNDPELIQEVLVSNAASFTKDAALKNNRDFFGNGLLSSEGQYWRRQRKLAAPAFSPKRLESYGQVMIEHTNAMLLQWHDHQTIDIQHEMMRLTLGIACQTLFDVKLSAENTELESALNEAQKYLADRMNDPLMLMLPEWIPFPTNVHLHQAIALVDKVIFSLIEQRRGKTDGRHDLLSTLMSVKDEDDGSGMSDKQIRDEVFTLFFAGHETTALTLTWTLYLLSQNPEVEEKLLSELKQVLNGRSPQVSDYTALSYTEKVIKESMRIRPPVWAIGRESCVDCTIGEYGVKKGTAIVISQWVMNHDQRYYQDPEHFYPDRWSSEFSQDLPKFAYFPFGGGPRTCIGNGFAMLEGVLALAAIVQDFHLSSVLGDPVDLVPAVTLRPAREIAMILHKRNT